MKALKALFVFSLVLSWSGSALAQDPVKVDSSHYKVILENASVRVLRIDYAAGGKSPMHQHPDAIVVPLTASKVQFTMADGKSETQDLPADGPSTRLPPPTAPPMSARPDRCHPGRVQGSGAGQGGDSLSPGGPVDEGAGRRPARSSHSNDC